MGFAQVRTPLDLNEVMTALAGHYSPPLQLDLQPGPAPLLADPHALDTLLVNLIDNARKYCLGTPHIVLQTRTRGKRLVWSVTDTGIGIEKAHHRSVFRQFYRVPTGDVHDVKGFGLGLYYVRQVARAHGWRVALTSVPGQGTTVSFSSALGTLPVSEVIDKQMVSQFTRDSI